MSPIVDKIDDFLTKLDVYLGKYGRQESECRIPLLPMNHTSPSVYSGFNVRKKTLVCRTLPSQSVEFGATVLATVPKM